MLFYHLATSSDFNSRLFDDITNKNQGKVYILLETK
jgi:hypothetical protein